MWHYTDEVQNKLITLWGFVLHVLKYKVVKDNKYKTIFTVIFSLLVKFNNLNLNYVCAPFINLRDRSMSKYSSCQFVLKIYMNAQFRGI